MAETPAQTPELTDSQIKEALEKTQAGPSKPIEVEIPGTPNKFIGASTEEVLAKLVEAQSASFKQYTADKEAKKQYEAQLAELRKALDDATKPKTQATGDQFDSAEYWKLMEKSPLEAANYLDRYRYGTDIDTLKGRLEHTFTKIDRIEQQEQSYIFASNNPDFPVGNKEAVNAILQDMAERGIDGESRLMTADEMEHSWLRLKTEGKIQPVNQEPAGPTTPTPPPSSPSGSGANLASIAELESQIKTMPEQKAKELLRSLGVKGI